MNTPSRLLILLLATVFAGLPAPAATFLVTTTADAGPGSLRQALTDANANPGPDVIHFDIPPAGVVHEIRLLSGLPPITDAVVIDGYTQPGSVPNSLAEGFNALNLVTLSGAGLGTPPPPGPGDPGLPGGPDDTPLGVHGIEIRADDTVVRGLRIIAFVTGGTFANRMSGVYIADSARTVIEGCVIGTSADTSLGAPNYGGITVSNGVAVRMGGPAPAQRNLLASNPGWQIRFLDSSSSVVEGNFIGLAAVVPAAHISNGPGVVFEGGRGNRVGGAGPGEGNRLANVGAAIDHDLGGAVQFLASAEGEVLGNWFGLVPPGVLCRLPGGNEPCGLGVAGVSAGVVIDNSTRVRVGGPGPGEGNVFAGGGAGVRITGAAAMDNRVQGNRIGTHPDGTAGSTHALAPSQAGNQVGVELVAGAQDNLVGGVEPGEGNLIANNNGDGVLLHGVGTQGNRILGNWIGVDVTGSEALPNGVPDGAGAGVRIDGGAVGNDIGGPLPGEGNLVSGNHNHGVRITGTQTRDNRVRGNVIGPDVTGTSRLPYRPVPGFPDRGNGLAGVRIDGGASNNQVGGAGKGEGNLISGNLAFGVELLDPADGETTSGNRILGNGIGLDANGTGALPNALGGVRLAATANFLGEPAPGSGNVVSGNTGPGVVLAGSANGVSGNRVGTDATGMQALPNEGPGIHIAGGDNLIGGTDPADGNVVSGNAGHGMVVTGPDAAGNRLLANLIGVDATGDGPLPNGGDGVHVTGDAHDNTIGSPGHGNVIAGNMGNGVAIATLPTVGAPTRNNGVLGNQIVSNGGSGVLVRGASTGNRILGNGIGLNGGLGIDLQAPGEAGGVVTPNDPLDADAGPNGLQNFPVITRVDAGPNGTVVLGSLHSAPGKSYIIEVFSSSDPDPSGHGEGSVVLGRVTGTTDASGNAPWSLDVGGIHPGDWLTATATDDAAGNTSEFGPALRVALPPEFAFVRQGRDDTGVHLEAGFETVPGVDYTVFHRELVDEGPWEILLEVRGTGEMHSFRVPVGEAAQRFFLLRQ